MYTRSFFSTLSLILLIGFNAFGSDNVTSIRENFSSFVVGSNPQVFSNNISFVFPNPFKAEIAEGELPIMASEGAKILSIKQEDPSVLKVFELEFDVPNEVNPGDRIAIKFKLKINSLKNSKYAVTLVDKSIKNEEPTLVFNPSGYLNVFYAEDSTRQKIGKTDNPQGKPLREGLWYQFEIIMDLPAQAFQINVENLSSATGGSTETLLLRRQLSEINSISFRPTNGAVREACIDWDIADIEVSRIP